MPKHGHTDSEDHEAEDEPRRSRSHRKRHEHRRETKRTIKQRRGSPRSDSYSSGFDSSRSRSASPSKITEDDIREYMARKAQKKVIAVNLCILELCSSGFGDCSLTRAIGHN